VGTDSDLSLNRRKRLFYMLSEFRGVFFNFGQIGLAAFDFDIFFVVFGGEIFDGLGRFFLQNFVYGYHLS
jgi:hypothetical protein